VIIQFAKKPRHSGMLTQSSWAQA